MSPHQNRPSRRVYPLAPRSGILSEVKSRYSGNGRPDFTHTHRNIRSKFHPVAFRLQSSPNGRAARGHSLPAASSGAVPRTAIYRRREPFGPSVFCPGRRSAEHPPRTRRNRDGTLRGYLPDNRTFNVPPGNRDRPHPTIVARNSRTRHRRNASLRRKFGGPFECVRADTHHPGRIEPQHSAVRSRMTDRLTNRGQIIAVTGTGTFQKKRGHSVHPLLRTVPENNASTVPIRLLILHSARLPHHLHTTRGQKSVRVRFVFSPSPRRSPTSRLRHRTPAPAFPLSIVLPPRSAHPVSLRIQDRAPEIPLPLPLHKTAMTCPAHRHSRHRLQGSPPQPSVPTARTPIVPLESEVQDRTEKHSDSNGNRHAESA